MKVQSVARWCAFGGVVAALAAAAPALSDPGRRPPTADRPVAPPDDPSATPGGSSTTPGGQSAAPGQSAIPGGQSPILNRPAGTLGGPSATTRLPECAPGKASTRPPTAPAGPTTPAACRANVTRIPESTVPLGRLRENTATGNPATTGNRPTIGNGATTGNRAPTGTTTTQATTNQATGTTPGGYHHLGAGTGGEWGGVSGRISVVNGTVRRNTYDFVAARFMVKRDLGAGKIAWLEGGWAETGWAGGGRQHIYTFDTETRSWRFYDQYALKAGDRVWLDLHTDGDNVWQAWLWWNNRWNLLTAKKLPVGSSAYVEQYVEVHVDPARRARVAVPSVTVDNVQLRPAGGGASRFWRDDVSTLTADTQQRAGGFCLTWLTRYDTWTAGDCPGLRVLRTAPEPPPMGDAEVVGDIAP